MYNRWLKRVALRKVLGWTLVAGTLSGATQLILVTGAPSPQGRLPQRSRARQDHPFPPAFDTWALLSRNPCVHLMWQPAGANRALGLPDKLFALGDSVIIQVSGGMSLECNGMISCACPLTVVSTDSWGRLHAGAPPGAGPPSSRRNFCRLRPPWAPGS